jgi:hypothetical protein
MKYLLGENWEPKLWGFLFALVFTINQLPSLIDFLPDGTKKYVVGICGLLAAVFAFMGWNSSKSTKVTGTGDLAQRPEDKK